MAWIGHSSGRSLPRCQAETVSHCSVRASAPPCLARSFLAWRPKSASLFCLLGQKHLGEDADQVLLDGPVLFVQVVELFLGGGLGAPDAAQQHLDQLVTAAHPGLAQQGEQQGVPPAWLGDVEDVAHFERRRLGGELPQLGMRDALQQRIGIDQPVHPPEAVGPERDCLGRCRSGRLLHAVEAGRNAVREFGKKAVQHCRALRREARRDAAVKAPVDFSAEPAHQPVEGAERRQIGGGRLQSLDRPADEVGRVAHGFGRAKDDAGHYLLGCDAIGRNRKVGPHRGLVAVERLREPHLVRPCGLRAIFWMAILGEV